MPETSDVQRLLDEQEVRRLKQGWAWSRDHGEWDAVRACFHPDATVTVSWYSGPASGFIERTIQLSAARKPEERSKHWIGNQRCALRGSRAVLETDAMVITRDDIKGQMFDYTAHCRFIDQVEKRGGAWKFFKWSTIYDKDRLEPVVPGAVPAGFFNDVVLRGPRNAVAFQDLRQRLLGRAMPPGLVLGGSEEEKTLRRAAAAWLAGG
jgi:hypothetical protein